MVNELIGKYICGSYACNIIVVNNILMLVTN